MPHRSSPRSPCRGVKAAGVAVDEDHVVAVTEPVLVRYGVDVVDGEVAADVVAPAGRIQDDVVLLPVEVGRSMHLFEAEAGSRQIESPSGGVLPAPLGVEAQEVILGGVMLLVVHVVVER